MPNRVLVIGDAMLDSYKSCSMDRISPEAPVPVLKIKEQFWRLGGAANVAAGVAAMGAPCDLLALAGSDANADKLVQLTAEAGIGDRIIRIGAHPTIVKERILAMRQQICRIDYEETFSPEYSRDLMQAACAWLDDYSVFIVSDYDKGCSHHLPDFMAAAREKGARVLVDPKRPDLSHYAGAFLVKPNWKEFVATARFERAPGAEKPISPKDHDAIRVIADYLMQKHDIAHLVVTMGADGFVHAARDGYFAAHPTKAREVFDLSGAGDSFMATLAAQLCRGADLVHAIELGNAAAGIAVGRVGTSVVDASDLIDYDTDMLDHAGKVARIRELAQLGKKIVFTNGCFDLLHVGHLTLLQQASAEGDILVVGVNSDASVRRLKGETRPIMGLDDRLAMLEGLRPVDFVLAFEEDTPQSLIEEVVPDVLVKGGDYTEDTIVGADFVKAHGGKLVIIPLVAGRSTTNIVAKTGRAQGQGDAS